jgi:hypothetical protein
MFQNKRGLIIIVLMIFFGCKLKENSKSLPLNIQLSEADQKIKEKWDYDYCGYLGIRDSLLYFFDTSNYLVGKDSVAIRNIFGKPYAISKKNGLFYLYDVEGYIDTITKKCYFEEGFIQKSLGISFDSSLKVNNITPMLY